MPMISKIISSNMVQDRAKVTENSSCVVMLCTCRGRGGGEGRGGEGRGGEGRSDRLEQSTGEREHVHWGERERLIAVRKRKEGGWCKRRLKGWGETYTTYIL